MAKRKLPAAKGFKAGGYKKQGTRKSVTPKVRRKKR